MTAKYDNFTAHLEMLCRQHKVALAPMEGTLVVLDERNDQKGWHTCDGTRDPDARNDH